MNNAFAILALCGVGALGTVYDEALASSCNTSTLQGTYRYKEGGTLEGAAYASVGTEVYDGRGNVTGIATDSETGESYRFTGTYDIDGDCHGQIVYAGDIHYDIYTTPYGESFESIATDIGAVVSGTSTRVSRSSFIK
jgi:hypothetical protein